MKHDITTQLKTQIILKYLVLCSYSFNPRYEEPQYCNYLKRYKVRWLDGVFQVSKSSCGVFHSFSPSNIYMASLTYSLSRTITLTNKSAIDLRIWKGRRNESTLKSNRDLK